MESADNQHSLEIAVISLASATARRARVREMLKESTLPWRIVDASSAEDRTLPYDEGRALIRHGSRLTAGEIGCFVSHYNCVREFALSSSSSKYLLVLEDDVWMDSSFEFSILPKIMSRLGLDYLMLYSRQIKNARFLGRIGVRSLFRFISPPWGNQAYIVSKQGAEKMINAIQRIDRPIDDEFQMYWINGLPTYALFPYPVIELNFASTLPKGYVERARFSPLQVLQRFTYRLVNKTRRACAHFLLIWRDKKISDELKKKDLYIPVSDSLELHPRSGTGRAEAQS